MNQITLHKAETRGEADYGWLHSHHTFSFANYHDPQRMGFGTLRVINDDVINPTMGFATHPHKNMEIISVPLSGSLRHRDTMGNEFVISKGEIQAMSAGTGISHSEYNHSAKDRSNFLQIWVLPKELDVPPHYSQSAFAQQNRCNQFQLIVSPDGRKDSVKINQDAFFSLIDLEMGNQQAYEKYVASNGVYLFVIEGEIEINGHLLQRRDGFGLEMDGSVQLTAKSNCEILLMEVPMMNH